MAIRPTAIPKLFPLSRFLLQNCKKNWSMTYSQGCFCFFFSRLRPVLTGPSTSKFSSETSNSNTKPVPIVKIPIADSTLIKSNTPMKQIKIVPIQRSKVESPKTATSSKPVTPPTKYTAVWDDTDKKFKVTRVDKADELLTKLTKYVVHCIASMFSRLKNMSGF